MTGTLIAAIFGGLGTVIGVVGKVIVDVIHAKKEPDQTDLELKDELQRQKEKNDNAIAAFTDFGKEIKGSLEEMKQDMTQKFQEMDEKIVIV